MFVAKAKRSTKLNYGKVAAEIRHAINDEGWSGMTAAGWLCFLKYSRARRSAGIIHKTVSQTSLGRALAKRSIVTLEKLQKFTK